MSIQYFNGIDIFNNHFHIAIQLNSKNKKGTVETVPKPQGQRENMEGGWEKVLHPTDDIGNPAWQDVL